MEEEAVAGEAVVPCAEAEDTPAVGCAAAAPCEAAVEVCADTPEAACAAAVPCAAADRCAAESPAEPCAAVIPAESGAAVSHGLQREPAAPIPAACAADLRIPARAAIPAHAVPRVFPAACAAALRGPALAAIPAPAHAARRAFPAADGPASPDEAAQERPFAGRPPAAACVAVRRQADAGRFPAAAGGRAIAAQAAHVLLKPADDRRRDSPSANASFKVRLNPPGPIAAAEHKAEEQVEAPDDRRAALQLPEDVLQTERPAPEDGPRTERPVPPCVLPTWLATAPAGAANSARAIVADRRGNLEQPTRVAAANSDRLTALDEPVGSTDAADGPMVGNGAARNAAAIGRSAATAAVAALGAIWPPIAARGNGAADFTIGTGIGTAGFPSTSSPAAPGAGPLGGAAGAADGAWVGDAGSEWDWAGAASALADLVSAGSVGTTGGDRGVTPPWRSKPDTGITTIPIGMSRWSLARR